MFHTISYYIGWFVIKILVKVRLQKDVVAQAPIPKGPKILVANHPTASDPFVVFSSMGERISILIFHKVFSIPVFGTYLIMAGHIPVIRGNGQQAFDRALGFLRRGISVLIFMEGDVSPQVGKFAKPRTGAVRLAYHSGAPIVPIGIGIHKKNVRYINGVIDGTPMRESWYLHGRYAITIGTPLHIEGNCEDRFKVRAMSKRIMSTIITLANLSTRRISPVYA